MSVSNDERETLHLMLDALLNARNYLENLDKSAFKGGKTYSLGWSEPLRELHANGSVFLRRVLGSKLHYEEMKHLFEANLLEDEKGADTLATLANALRSFLPLFLESGRSSYQNEGAVISKIIEDFMGVYWGDEPRFFAVWPRRQGLHKRPYRLARLRLTALDWDKYLAAVGVSTFSRHRLISEAYRTDWEAIRKWAKSINEQFDLGSYPPTRIDWAIAEYAEDPDAIHAAIRSDGDAYWLERSTAQSGKE